jgi:hypothetical protein
MAGWIDGKILRGSNPLAKDDESPKQPTHIPTIPVHRPTQDRKSDWGGATDSAPSEPEPEPPSAPSRDMNKVGKPEE